MTDQTFPRQERLKDTRRIREVFASRVRHSTDGMRLIAKQNDLPHNRVLIAPSRGYGNAVERNRVKRIGREIYRHLRHRLMPGWDLAFIFYAVADDSYAVRESQMISLCRKARILRPTGD